MKLALVPARGGSKRIPRKNIREFLGRPIIAFTIDSARRTGLFDRIIVSTDDDEIAAIAESVGAEAPFRRPPEIANDTATTMAVIQHALAWAAGESVEPTHLCCLYPASPFIRAADIAEALEVLEAVDADYCFPVTAFASPIERALRITAEGRLAMVNPGELNTRSQDLEPAYHDAGQFYWGRTAAFAEGRPLFSPQAVPLKIPSWRVVDIDTPDDWARAELIYDALRQRGDL